jgi:ParB-like chromosome segregation protein Spo0J
MLDFDKALESIASLVEGIDCLDDKIEAINKIKIKLHDISPLSSEPVDCVIWVKNDTVISNDYNPNSVAPPEMELLYTSIKNDGYTQPIVTWHRDDINEVIDGFHRHRIGKEKPDIKERISGYLPVVRINNDRQEKGDRIASTIRHNRARGKHRVDSMSEIVIELKNRNWTNQRIAKELGMDEDEILRLCQITGLADLFSDGDFSRSWDVEGSSPDDFVFESIDDEAIGKDEDVRTVNTNDSNRVFHTFDKWECHKAGFYATSFNGIKQEECERMYADFLSNLPRFEAALDGVISKWVNSCEHYLTNQSMNRIAWLGQASVCYDCGIPSKYCSGFNLLSEQQQNEANMLALQYLNKYLVSRGMEEVSIDDAMTSRQSVLY